MSGHKIVRVPVMVLLVLHLLDILSQLSVVVSHWSGVTYVCTVYQMAVVSSSDGGCEVGLPVRKMRGAAVLYRPGWCHLNDQCHQG